MTRSARHSIAYAPRPLRAPQTTQRRQQDGHTIATRRAASAKRPAPPTLPYCLHADLRVLLVDIDPQFALTRQLGAEERSLGVNLVDVLAGRAATADAIVPHIHGVDLIPAAAGSPASR